MLAAKQKADEMLAARQLADEMLAARERALAAREKALLTPRANNKNTNNDNDSGR